MKLIACFFNSFCDVYYGIIISWSVYITTLLGLLPNMASSRQFLYCLTIKFSHVTGMCVSSIRFTISLGPCVKVRRNQCEAGQCGSGVRPWLPTGKSGKVATAVLLGFEFEVMDDDVRVEHDKLDTNCWPAYTRTCSRIMTLLKPGVVRMTGGRKWANIHRWVDANRHSNWRSNPTDEGNRGL